MKVKIKKLHPDAVVPSYAKPGDAGVDLVATEISVEHGMLTCKTGISMEIPEGYVGLIYPRSSISKTTCRLANCVGVIDAGYRGEIFFKFDYAQQIERFSEYLHNDDIKYKPTLQNKTDYKKGDRIGQMIIMPFPTVEFEEVEELSETERGDGGFGSTGK